MPEPAGEVLGKFARRGALSSLATQLLSVAGALLFASVLMFGLNLFGMHNQIVADRNADRTIEQLDRIENHLLALELTVRGYALTGDASFQTHYRIERAKLAEAVAPLPQLISGTEVHKQCFERLRAALGERTSNLVGMMETARTSAAVVARAITDPGVRNTMRIARAAIIGMRDMETARRDSIAAASEAEARRGTVWAGIVLGLAFVFGVLGLSFALFGHQQRQ